MKLYHGTSFVHLENILRDGLQPRNTLAGNWATTLNPSIPTCVYLSDSLAPYFALWCQPHDDHGLVIEIETDRLDPQQMVPDEDFLRALFTITGEPILPFDDIAGWQENILEERHRWSESLRLLGTCAYHGTIPPEAITRYAIVEHTVENLSRFDNCVNAKVYSILADQLRANLPFLFDGIFPEPTPFDDTIMLANPPRIIAMDHPEWPDLYEQKKKRQLKQRETSVTIIDVCPDPANIRVS